MNQPNIDQYGYYQFGDFKTYSIYQLMDYYQKNPHPYKPIQWIYNDNFFSQFDWSQEPTASLDQLYKKRAEELRKKYDYIVIYYSGGFDSSNMLRAFLDNGIYPDEICVFYSRYDTTGHQYHELKDFTWKKLAQIEQQYPQIKIRRFDYGDIICNWPKIIEDLNLNVEPIYLFGPRLSVNRLALDVMHEYIDDWQKLLREKKTLCTLHGVDSVQPRHIYKENRWIHNFFDTYAQGHFTPIRQMINKNNRDTLEFFYWAPTETCANIIIKQGHLAKKFFTEKVNNIIEKLYGMKEFAIVNKKQPGEMSFRVWDYEPFKKLIYPKIFISDEKYYNKKETSTFWGNRDLWYYDSDLPGSKEHRIMYHSLFNNEKNHWKNWFLDRDIGKGPIKIKSKDYII